MASIGTSWLFKHVFKSDDVTPDFVQLKTFLKVNHIKKTSGKLMADTFQTFVEGAGNLEKLERNLQHDFVMEKL